MKSITKLFDFRKKPVKWSVRNCRDNIKDNKTTESLLNVGWKRS